ncbi:MAG: DedA family protein [Limisphaerales bacterium]
MLKDLIAWYMGALDSYGYPLVALMMAVESTLVPLPSELIIPFAATYIEKGRFNAAGIIIAGTLGSWAGATIMYWAARLAGRELIVKYGKYFLISEEKIHAAENWVANFGPFGVFVSRLLPVVRHLIGIPMGMAKMNFKLYSLFTLLGSAVWCSVLCWIGVVAGKDKQLLEGNLQRTMIWVIGAILVIGILYFLLVRRFMNEREKK